MKEFNHRRAWQELAYPKFLQLPEEIKVLFKLVQDTCGGQHQNKSLGMDWPNDEFKAAFDAIEPELLSEAAAIIYGLGHWDYREPNTDEYVRDGIGASWKFEKFAIQSMIDRGCYAKVPKFDTSEFMDHKEGTDLDLEELGEKYAGLLSEMFTVRKVDHVNHRVDISDTYGKSAESHPFVIGSKHMQNTTSIYLDPTCAPCAHCGCEYEYHVSDTVMFIGVNRDTSKDDKVELTDVENELLMSIKETMNEDKIDGFAFVK